MTLSDCSYNFNKETDKNHFLFLLEVQLEEIRTHTDKYKQANEFCDIISICVEFLTNNGFNLEETMNNRKLNVKSRKEQVIEKYTKMMSEKNVKPDRLFTN